MAQAPDHVGRFVHVSWSESAEEQYRKAGIRILVEDRMGVLADLTRIISLMNITILASNSRSDPRSHRATIRFRVLVRDVTILSEMMDKLRQVDDVVRVTRDSKFR